MGWGGGGGMEGDDWTIWHPVNRGVLCASGLLWNRSPFYRMKLVLKLNKSCGGDLPGMHSPAIHLRLKYLPKDCKCRPECIVYKGLVH